MEESGKDFKTETDPEGCTLQCAGPALSASFCPAFLFVETKKKSLRVKRKTDFEQNVVVTEGKEQQSRSGKNRLKHENMSAGFSPVF